VLLELGLAGAHGDHDHDHHGHALSEADKKAMADFIWRQENVELTTVGIDIGSSTSHLLFAKVVMQRRTQQLSSRFVVVRREVLWRSPIIHTPFLPDGSIDAAHLEDFIHRSYHEAGLRRQDIDSGAVILTGEAIKRKNARAIDELFADEAGKFVCATAGHKLECVLAAHGSGAVRLSKERSACILHVDIGGGTTKLALIKDGQILSVAAFAVGGRLLAQDQSGQWTRIDDSARLVAEDLGLSADSQTMADPKVRQRIAQRLSHVAVDYLKGDPLDRLGMALQLTEPLVLSETPELLTFSGGVSEYVLYREEQEFGDIAKLLADSLRAQLKQRLPLPVADPGHGIRATVIGASQFTVQVSGKTIYLPDSSVLPVHNVPVVYPALDLSGDSIDPAVVTRALREGLDKMDLNPQATIAIALRWEGIPIYHRLEAVGRGIMDAVAPKGHRQSPLMLIIDGDVGELLGQVLHKELGLSGGLVSLDGIQLQELDFVDLGQLLEPPGVVPVVIKSLLFS
jgi:ethanolamine utilization protein EutA